MVCFHKTSVAVIKFNVVIIYERNRGFSERACVTRRVGCDRADVPVGCGGNLAALLFVCGVIQFLNRRYFTVDIVVSRGRNKRENIRRFVSLALFEFYAFRCDDFGRDRVRELAFV